MAYDEGDDRYDWRAFLVRLAALIVVLVVVLCAAAYAHVNGPASHRFSTVAVDHR